MEIDNRNQQTQLPYEKLALLGIDREKADRLPQEFRQKLVDGEVTPLMQVSITARNGNVITLPLKLQMALDQTGQAVLIAYPVRKALDEEKVRELRLTTNEAEVSARVMYFRKPSTSTERRHNIISSSIRKRSP